MTILEALKFAVIGILLSLPLATFWGAVSTIERHKREDRRK